MSLIGFHLLWRKSLGFEQDAHILQRHTVRFWNEKVCVNASQHCQHSEEDEGSVRYALERIRHGVRDIELSELV